MTARRVLIAAFALSWVFLLLWSFGSVRMAFARFATKHIHWAFPGGGGPMLPLSGFTPQTQLKPWPARAAYVRPAFPTIEMHGHIFRKAPKNFEAAMDQAGQTTFVNLAGRTVTAAAYKKLKRKFPSDRIIHFVGLNWKHARKDRAFGKAMARDLEAVAQLGGKGVKIWKNFGIYEKDPDGKRIAMDDPRLDPVWDVCARYRLVVSIHTADPPAFFDPIDGNNERYGELGRRPSWTFHGKDYPAFGELLAERDRLFGRRKDVAFIAVHFAELAHDLRRADLLLRKYPHVYLDIAQRIDELGRQPRAARRFFLRWADRIVYGTDGLPDFKKIRIYWRFLESSDEYFDYHPLHKPRKGLWKIHGLGLPTPVLRKIYRDNALGLLRRAGKKRSR